MESDEIKSEPEELLIDVTKIKTEPEDSFTDNFDFTNLKYDFKIKTEIKEEPEESENQVEEDSRSAASTFPNSPDSTCKVVIEEQPMEKVRFRYLSELQGTPHGPLLGERSTKCNKSFPRVKLEGYYGIEPVKIRCWLVDKAPSSLGGDIRPHCHDLVVRKNISKNEIVPEPHEIAVSRDNNYTAVFENMVVLHCVQKNSESTYYNKEVKWNRLKNGSYSSRNHKFDKKKIRDTMKCINKNEVYLFFEAFMERRDSDEILCSVLSNPIKNLKNPVSGDLKIIKVVNSCGPAEGNTEIALFTEKVPPDVKVIFANELNDWKELVQPETTHRNLAITIRSPKYPFKSDKSVKVRFCLYRESDGCESNTMEFTYLPSECVVPGKRKRTAEVSNENHHQLIDPLISQASMSRPLECLLPQINHAIDENLDPDINDVNKIIETLSGNWSGTSLMNALDGVSSSSDKKVEPKVEFQSMTDFVYVNGCHGSVSGGSEMNDESVIINDEMLDYNIEDLPIDIIPGNSDIIVEFHPRNMSVIESDGINGNRKEGVLSSSDKKVYVKEVMPEPDCMKDPIYLNNMKFDVQPVIAQAQSMTKPAYPNVNHDKDAPPKHVINWTIADCDELPYTTERYSKMKNYINHLQKAIIRGKVNEVTEILRMLESFFLFKLPQRRFDVDKLFTDTINNIRNNKFQTLLHIAIQCNHPDIVKALLDFGYDPLIQDNNGNNCFFVAASKPTKSVLQTLISRTVRVGGTCENPMLNWDRKAFLNPSVLSLRNSNGLNVLHIAVRAESIENVKYLLQTKLIDVNSKDMNSGDTSLHIACRLENKEIAQLLIQNGAKVNEINLSGFTPLHVSVTRNDHSMASLLIKQKSDPRKECISLTNDKISDIKHSEMDSRNLPETREDVVEELYNSNDAFALANDVLMYNILCGEKTSLELTSEDSVKEERKICKNDLFTSDQFERLCIILMENDNWKLVAEKLNLLRLLPPSFNEPVKVLMNYIQSQKDKILGEEDPVCSLTKIFKSVKLDEAAEVLK